VHTIFTALEMLQCPVGQLHRMTNMAFAISSEKAIPGNWLTPWSDSQ